MAKFGSYFGLCPLIDQKSLLGISEDFEKEHVIVTLGKNIAMKYRLLDQNQIISWTTKEKFTSPVIFDAKIGKYVAVFNHLFIRCWESDTSNLDRVKKFKLKSAVETIIVINETTIVIFKSGDMVSLEYALANHKTLMPEEILDVNEEYIVDNMFCTLRGDKYVGLLIGNSNTKRVSYLLWRSFDSKGNKSMFSKYPLRRNHQLVGSCFQLFDQKIQFLTLWSDGKLYRNSIEDNCQEHSEFFCTIKSISCRYPLSMVSLDRDYLAIYGGNSNQEGALLLIYNMQFKVTQCTQPFKLEAMGVKLFKIYEKLLVPVGQNLAVVPYYLENEQLSALVGSHSGSQNNEEDILITQQLEEVNWTGNNEIKKKKSKNYSIIEEYLSQGCPESTIFQELLPVFMEKTNIEGLNLLLQDFIDIPESCHAKVLRYILELPGYAFKNTKLVLNEVYPEELQPNERYKTLKLILEKPIKEINNIYWRLEVTNILKLLKFILYLLKDDKNITDIDFCMKLVKWVNLILSANCQIFFSSRDEELMKILVSFNEFINSGNSNSEFLYAEQVMKKKKTTRPSNCNYLIEKLEI
ncbi:nucleolar protein 11 [Coccinella septempunctata]|uniref:nucleolar protein 11 n=1 Tax=Coccinella septempunctata TaxID=41139 RepID=UPI001D060A63|nr:nucleolar protein 11 [Coccinella septempunctata]